MKHPLFLAFALASFLMPHLVHADQESDLKARFQSRFPRLVQLKQQGVIGETSKGFIAMVHPESADSSTKSFVQDENTDRTALYALIAAKEGTTPDAVAKTNAQRNFDRAKPGEWLKEDDGVWRQKAA